MNARELALRVLCDVFPATTQTRERGAQEAFEYRARSAGLDARDRAFATQLAYGSIKMRRALDWYLQPFIGARREKLPSVILEILRLAIYELTYMRADVHATVFEFVNLAKKYGHKGVVGLTNAVLRSFLRAQPAAPAREQFADADEYLGTLHSLPTWLVKQWRSAFPDAIEAICAGVNGPPAAGIVVNTLHAPVAEIERAFAEANVACTRSAFVEEALIVADAASLRARSDAADRAWWPQSESSAMPVAMLNPQPGEAVLDVASGRGNKALQIATRMQSRGTLECVEREEKKVARLVDRLRAAGVEAAVVQADATAPPSGGRRFDRALVDAPCSGIGVVGRHPEARWRKRPGDGERLAVTQIAMLEAAAGQMREGGVLVYAVCSTDSRETVEVVETFLRSQDFSRGLVPAAFAPFITTAGDVLVPPGVDGRDGFYIARMERRL